MSVNGKTVLVTGASRGLGRAVAEAFLRAGARVLALGRDPDAMAATRAALDGIGGAFEMVPMDVRDEEKVTACIADLDRLDVLVNNAGIAAVRPFIETPTQELRDILDVNVIAAFVVMREAVKKMLATGGGHVINIASDAAIRGIGRMAPYVASKHALLGIGRSVSLELRQHGIRVTTFCPGPITTDIMGTGTANPDALPPDELAKMIVHLAGLPPEIDTQELLIQPAPRWR
ncbi:MAG: SDR family oxidoreductase [Candidatus Latescibacteria bacterium]|nr:SDR family oxidoreductase [Candidatus Latescibacterota bacterium]